MNKKHTIYLFLVVIFLLQSACFSAEKITIEQLRETYRYLSAREILYYGESNLDNDEELEKIIAIYDGEFSFLKLLIAKKGKIIYVFDLDVTPAYSKILNINYKDILNLSYNQIIIEIYFPTYDRGFRETKTLNIIAFVNGNYKEIFNHEIEDSYRDNIEGWSRLIQWNYSIISGKNAKIIFTNTKNSLVDANNKKLEPPKIDKTDEYIWNGAEFKRKKE